MTSLLDALDALLAKATPGRPWKASSCGALWDIWAPGDPKSGATTVCDFAGKHDAALIVAAVNALPDLLAAARALSRAAYVAEHLFSMIDRQTWRDSGGDDGQGHYEGDYWAEKIQNEIKEWPALARLGAKGDGAT